VARKLKLIDSFLPDNLRKLSLGSSIPMIWSLRPMIIIFQRRSSQKPCKNSFLLPRLYAHWSRCYPNANPMRFALSRKIFRPNLRKCWTLLRSEMTIIWICWIGAVEVFYRSGLEKGSISTLLKTSASSVSKMMTMCVPFPSILQVIN